MRIALDELLENAVKYTEEGDAIELRARELGAEITIEIADEGCEIAPDAAARIFDRFARGDAARTRAQGGAGLGLAIVDAIAKAHGGSCAVVTNGSDGDSATTFALRLPRARALAAGPAGDPAAAAGL